MNRFENWPELLQQAIEDLDGIPFQYGTHDCALAVANVVLTFTGIDLAADLRGTYSDQAGADAIVTAHTDMAGLAEYLVGLQSLEEVPIAFAQRGDAVLLDGELGPTFAIVDMTGVHAATAALAGGTVAMPISTWLRAWRVG